MGGCTLFRKEKCFISAYDANDGRQLWKFATVATTGAPGGDTWGDVPDLYRAGGDTWITGSYDPELDTTYWGVAQAKPWVPASRGNSALDRALYTSTTLALNPNDGSLKWYYQHAPGEALDLDEVYERVLIDVGGEKAVFTIGKPGILWKLDRETRPLPRSPRDGVPERLRPHRSRDRRAALPRRHRRRQGRRMGSRLPEHGRRPQLAGDDASRADVSA